MRRLFRILARVCFCVMTFLFLGSSIELRAGELSVLYTDPHLMKPVHKSFKEHYEATYHGESAKLDEVRDYSGALELSLRESVIGSTRDIVYHGLSNICLLAARGLAKPLDGLIKNDSEWRNLGISNDALNVTKCNGVVYGMPLGGSVMVVIFNKTLVQKAGGDPNNLPTTWPEILSLARKIDDRSGRIYYNYDTPGSWSFMSLVLSQGGQILTADGKDIAFDSPQGLKALQILAEIGSIRQSDMTKSQARQAFGSGALGILVDSSSGLVNYKRAAEGMFDLGVVALPLAENGKIPISGMAGVIQTERADRKRQAWEYIKYAASPEGQTLVGKLTGFLPFNEIVVSSPEFLGSYYAGNPELLVSVKSMKNAAAWPSFPGPNGLKISTIILDYLQKVLGGVLSPEEALAQMAVKSRALLK
jgi:multiple sugar transport system substrate-binding protein